MSGEKTEERKKTKLDYEKRKLTTTIFMLLVLFLIVPVLLWTMLFVLFVIPIEQFVWLLMIIVYYIIALAMAYLMAPLAFRRVFSGTASDDYERQYAEDTLSEEARAAGARSASTMDANVIARRSGRRVTVDSADRPQSSAVADEKRVYASSVVFCPQCGQPNMKTDDQCIKCASKLVQPGSPGQQEGPGQQNQAGPPQQQ